MGSQLAAIMGGKKDIKNMGEGAAKNALNEATGQLARQKKMMATLKENAAVTATQAVCALEMHGAAFLSAMASGYRGEKALKVGPVDARLVGVPVLVWGFYESLMGRGGHHQLAIGNGLLISYNVEQGMILGHRLREMRASDTAPAQTSTTTTSDNTVQINASAEGDVREILLHPAVDGRKAHRDPAPPPPPRRRVAR